MFDQSDMAAVKEKIGAWACIGGNVPASLFKAGSPQQMEDYVKSLIEVAGPDGGYFICPGAAVDDATTENVQAFLDASRKYASY
jgi:uroporphyrinogen-III decarboxylase